MWVGLFIPGANSGQMGGYVGCCGSMAGKGMVCHGIGGNVHRLCKDKEGSSKRNKGNIPADMVEVQGLLVGQYFLFLEFN